MSSVLVLLAGLGIPGGQPVGPPLERHVELIKELECRSASGQGWLTTLEVRLAVPDDGPRQAIENLTFAPEPEGFVRDAHGNRFAVYRRARLDAGAVWMVGWSCRARLREVHHDPAPEQLLPPSDVPGELRGVYLGDARKYGLSDPALKAAAAGLVREAADAHDLAFRINEYVRQHLVYRNDGRWDPAPRVLANGHGSCSEYSFLFMALARLAGLPARYVGASALRSDEDVYEDFVHHRWTEVWLPGHGWYPVDCSRNDGEDGAPVNRWFGRTSARLLVLMRGDGGAEHPLGWGYVATADAGRRGDARLVRRKRFVWRRPAPFASAGGGFEPLAADSR